MCGNLAYEEDIREELLDGKSVMMSPRPAMNHNFVSFNIASIFRDYLRDKTCVAVADGSDVYLTEKDRVIPDAMIVCDRSIIKRDGIYGAPDLVVEVLSPSTAKRDKGYKKNLYAHCGVKEYWIVDIKNRAIEVYLPQDGVFELDSVYQLAPDDIELSEEEKKDYQQEIKVSLFDGFYIPLDEIFENLI